ncbi:hypothetical protein D3C78_1385700 [compost metagenome]
MPRPPLRIETSATTATTQFGAKPVKWITSASKAPTPDSAKGHHGFFRGAGVGVSAPWSSGSACMPKDLMASTIGSTPGKSWVTPSTRLIRLNSNWCTPVSLLSLFWISVCSVGQSIASMRKLLSRAPGVGDPLSFTSAGAAASDEQQASP